MASGDMILINGGELEGGGQILRNAATLSCLLRKPIKVNNIRAGRDNPGLRPQHLAGLQLVRDICDGRLEGGEVGSTEISLYPGEVRGGTYLADTKTAGSVCLLMQAALPCLLYANQRSDIELRGGTNADFAPQIDYFEQVFFPMVDRFGVDFNCNIRKRGYFPKGGGIVHVQAVPAKCIAPIDLTDSGDIRRITGVAFVAGVLPLKVAQTMAREATNVIKKHYGKIPVNIEARKYTDAQSFGNGSGINLVAETSTGCLFGGSALGKRQVPAEKVGSDAAQVLLRNLSHGGCVDEYLQDQLILLMALAKGKSRVLSGALTLHTETAIWVAQQLTQAKFEIKQMNEETFMIECDGIGLENIH